MIDTLIVAVAQYAIFLLPIFILVIAAYMNKATRIEYFAALLIGGLLGLVGILVASSFLYDPRPFVSGHVVPLFTHVPDNGFPSDHTTLGVLLAGISIFYARKLGIAMLIIALAIGAARVLAHVHSWIDIAGGISVALVASLLAVFITKYGVSQWRQHSQPLIKG